MYILIKEQGAEFLIQIKKIKEQIQLRLDGLAMPPRAPSPSKRRDTFWLDNTTLHQQMFQGNRLIYTTNFTIDYIEKTVLPYLQKINELSMANLRRYNGQNQVVIEECLFDEDELLKKYCELIRNIKNCPNNGTALINFLESFKEYLRNLLIFDAIEVINPNECTENASRSSSAENSSEEETYYVGGYEM